MSIFFSVIKFCILSFYGHVTFLDSVLIQSCLKLNSSFQNDGFWSNFHYQFEKFNNPIIAFQSEPFKIHRETKKAIPKFLVHTPMCVELKPSVGVDTFLLREMKMKVFTCASISRIGSGKSVSGWFIVSVSPVSLSSYKLP